MLQSVPRGRNDEFARFFEFGTAPAKYLASAEHPPNHSRRNRKMTEANSFSSRLAAAASALMLSLVLFTNTVSTPAEVSNVNLASAYVGAVA